MLIVSGIQILWEQLSIVCDLKNAAPVSGRHFIME